MHVFVRRRSTLNHQISSWSLARRYFRWRWCEAAVFTWFFTPAPEKKRSLLDVCHFQKGGSGEGRLHFKLIQERFFFFLIRCIVHLSQNSFLPRTQTGRGETVVQSNEGWYRNKIWFIWEQKYVRRKLKSMINLTIKACFKTYVILFLYITI